MRHTHKVALACGLAVGALVLGILREPVGAAVREQSNIDRGFEVAPVELDLRGKNRRLVGLGSYLVNVVAACNDCHTNPPYAPGGNPQLGEPKQINTANYLAGGTPLAPGIVSFNITPNETGLPAGHSYGEFVEQMRQGFNHHRPNDVLQVMPWPFYSQMSDLDLRAIYEYLRSIPHAEPAAGAKVTR
jgi:hypothetical protein